MYEIALARYFGEGKIELFLRKIECSIGIKLKTTLSCPINEAWLKKCLKSVQLKRSAIIIIVGNSTEAIQLCSRRLRFKATLKAREKY